MNVYADNAATAPMRKTAKVALLECLEDFGNPSSVHTAGKIAAAKLEKARKTVAELLNCRPSEIYFTSGGTEADNWALRSAASPGSNIITSAFEHHAILHTLEAMEQRGQLLRGVIVPPERDGIMDPEKVCREITATTSMVTIMAANNEIGTIQPVEEIARKIRKAGGRNIIMHTDAVQAVGHIPVDVEKLGVDMLSISAHKFGGPRGIGVLYCRTGIKLDPLMFGGGQERGRRPGTENVAAAVAMAAAMRESCEEMGEAARKVKAVRDFLITQIREIPGNHIHGNLENRLPGNINCSFDGVEGEAAVLMLDVLGVCVSAGSACTSGSGEASHVLTAIGVPPKDAYGAIRITLGEKNTKAEAEYIAKSISKTVRELRG